MSTPVVSARHDTAALAADMQTTDALLLSDLDGDQRVLTAVMLRLALAWWREILAVAPAEQRYMLGVAGIDGLAAADSFMFSLCEPTVNSANMLLTASMGVASLLMNEDNAWGRLSGPAGSDGPKPGSGVGFHRSAILGVRGLPWLPPHEDVRPVRWVPQVERLDASRPWPFRPGETGPLGFARQVAAWYWAQARSGKRLVCEHGVIHHPDGEHGCDGRHGRWAACDGCPPCQPSHRSA